MTVGIISALGRTLPAQDKTTLGPVLIRSPISSKPMRQSTREIRAACWWMRTGQVIGVTAAIESTSNANAGIGFAIPLIHRRSKVVPELIESGKYEHPYLGISGTV